MTLVTTRIRFAGLALSVACLPVLAAVPGWTDHPSGTTVSLRAVLEGPELLAFGDSGKILVSGDASIWTPRASGTTRPLYAAVRGANGVVVAVGDSGEILTSQDAVSWTRRASGVTQPLRSVTWVGNRFVAVGNGGTLLFSDDGASWISGNAGTSGNLVSVAWTGSRLIVGAASGFARGSADGVQWDSVRVGNSSRLWGIMWGGGGLLAFAPADTMFLPSRVPGGLMHTYPMMLYRMSFYRSPDGLEWSGGPLAQSASASPYPDLRAIAWTGDRYVAVGKGWLASSDADFLWKAGYYPAPLTASSFAWNSAVWTGNRLLVVGDSGRIATTSSDSAVSLRAFRGLEPLELFLRVRTDGLKVHAPHAPGADVFLFSAAGARVRSAKLSREGRLSLPLAGLQPGVYLLRIEGLSQARPVVWTP